MTTFTRDWTGSYEGLPSDIENINLGAGRIRNTKVDVRERLQVDHAFGDNGPAEADDGKHLKVTFLPQAVSPTLDAGNGALYVQTISGNAELIWKDSAGHILQLTTGGVLAIPNSFVFPGNLAVDGTFGVVGLSTFGNVAIGGTLGVTSAVSITASLSVGAGGIATSGNVIVSGAVDAGSVNSTGPITATGGIAAIEGNSDFFLGLIGGLPAFAGGTNGAFVRFNPAVPQWEFYIGNALVGHIP